MTISGRSQLYFILNLAFSRHAYLFPGRLDTFENSETILGW